MNGGRYPVMVVVIVAIMDVVLIAMMMANKDTIAWIASYFYDFSQSEHLLTINRCIISMHSLP